MDAYATPIQSPQFAKRVQKISTKHRKLSRGQRKVVDKNMLLTVKPRRQIGVPTRGLVFAISALLVYKAWLIHSLGGAEYVARLDQMSAGTTVEQIGAVLMRPEIVSLNLAEIFARLF